MCVSSPGIFSSPSALRLSSIRFVRFKLLPTLAINTKQFVRSPACKACVLMPDSAGGVKVCRNLEDLKNHRMRRATWTRPRLHFRAQEYKVYLQMHISKKMQWQQTPWISHHKLILTDLPKLLIKASLRTLVFYLIILIKWTPMSPLMRIKL